MALFVVERHLPRLTLGRLVVAQLALVQASRRLTGIGLEVSYVRSTFLPASGRCSCAFEAATRDLVRQVNDEAGFAFSSIEEAVELPAPMSAGAAPDAHSLQEESR